MAGHGLTIVILALGQWVEAPAVKSPPRVPSRLLADIESRMPAGHQYRNDSTPVNWGHETTHGLNSRIRNVYGGTGRLNAFYVGGGRACVLREPRLTLAQVAAAVPADMRGGSYSLYLVQQRRHWNGQPLYILDEWVAYLNGTEIAVEYAEAGVRLPNETLTAEYTHEFSAYAMELLHLAWRLPSYVGEREKLESFVHGQIRRSYALQARVRKHPHLHRQSQEDALGRFVSRYVRREPPRPSRVPSAWRRWSAPTRGFRQGGT